MSYCVNCGVKLAKSEKKCPLCNTKVINPNQINETFEPAYSAIIEKFQLINFRFILKLIFLVIFIISVIFFCCDFILTKSITWSIYAVSIMFYLCCHLSFLIIKNLYLNLTINFIGTELFIFIIAFLNNGMHLFRYIIFPLLLIMWLYLMLCIFFFKKNRKNKFRKFSLCFLFSSMVILIMESSLDLYKYETINLTWSLYAAFPIVVIGLIIFSISFNKKLLEEIKQRIFI